MMMKLKVFQLYELDEGLADLGEKELPIGTSLKIQRTHKAVKDELDPINKVRQKIVDKYKDEVLEDGGVKIKQDKIEVCRKELDELMNQEVEIKVSKINVKELESISVKPKTLGMIGELLVDGGQDEA